MSFVRAAVGAGIAIVMSPMLLQIVCYTATTVPSRRHIGAFVAVVAAAGACVATWPPTSITAGALLVVLGVPAATVDALEHRIPNRLSLSLAAGTAVALGAVAVIEGALPEWTRAMAGGAIWSGLLAASFLVTGHPGPGDIKLAVSLGMTLGWLSWNAIISGVVLAYLLAAVAGAIGLVTRRLCLADGRLPMAPPMLAATIATAIALT
ncbi:prepilin peptidase [Amycolatopsis sp. NPDC059657]|uniref:prepilin peptidase n=1 Tax=Amycolatopsis sp. NPDC059657 TaxID=3346899 RepID=UPI00366D4BB4